MAAPQKKETEIRLDFTPGRGLAQVGIYGESPLIFNRMAMKARSELLYPSDETPSQKKKSGRLKHDPLQEYRDSVYRRRDNEKGPTRLLFPSPAFKGAIATAATDIPGVAKTKINRLIWIEGYSVDVFGVPEMIMAPVRSSDQNRTPDIRTRAILRNWGCVITISFIKPFIKDSVLATLADFAGTTVGIGDWRQEKGSGNYGRYVLCSPDDKKLQVLMKMGGMAAQDAALNTNEPACFDTDTEDLWGWFKAERLRRATATTIAVKKPKTNRRTKEADAELRV